MVIRWPSPALASPLPVPRSTGPQPLSADIHGAFDNAGVPDEGRETSGDVPSEPRARLPQVVRYSAFAASLTRSPLGATGLNVTCCCHDFPGGTAGTVNVPGPSSCQPAGVATVA